MRWLAYVTRIVVIVFVVVVVDVVLEIVVRLPVPARAPRSIPPAVVVVKLRRWSSRRCRVLVVVALGAKGIGISRTAAKLCVGIGVGFRRALVCVGERGPRRVRLLQEGG